MTLNLRLRLNLKLNFEFEFETEFNLQTEFEFEIEFEIVSFSTWVFFYNHLRFTEQQGKGETISLKSDSHPPERIVLFASIETI